MILYHVPGTGTTDDWICVKAFCVVRKFNLNAPFTRAILKPSAALEV